MHDSYYASPYARVIAKVVVDVVRLWNPVQEGGVFTGVIILFTPVWFLSDTTRCHPPASLSIVVVLKGFIAGCSDGGLRLYMMDPAEISNPSKMFECKQTWRVDTTADVVSGTTVVQSQTYTM